MLSFDPLAQLKAHAFKLAAGLFLITSLIAGWLWLDTRGDLRDANAQVVKVAGERDEANRQLGACDTKLDEQSADIRKLSDQFTAAQGELASERKRSAKAIRDLTNAKARFDAYQPKGATVGERMIDTHRAFIQELRGTE